MSCTLIPREKDAKQFVGSLNIHTFTQINMKTLWLGEPKVGNFISYKVKKYTFIKQMSLKYKTKFVFT